MIKVEDREKIRRAYFKEKKSQRQIARQLGHSRKTVRKAIAWSGPCRPPIPMHAIHPFRAMSTMCSDGVSTTFPGDSESLDGIIRIQWTACSEC